MADVYLTRMRYGQKSFKKANGHLLKDRHKRQEVNFFVVLKISAYGPLGSFFPVPSQRPAFYICDFSFRFATYDVVNNTQYRTLIKAYGIRFVILVDAKVGFTVESR